MGQPFGQELAAILQLRNLHPDLMAFPFVQGLVEEGRYRPHPDEPSIFATVQNGVTMAWLGWIYHLVIYGPEHLEHFRYGDSSMLHTVGRMAKLVSLYLHKELTRTDIVLPPEPPPLLTANQKYVSQAWVLDIARRDNMPPHEAALLGAALMG